MNTEITGDPFSRSGLCAQWEGWVFFMSKLMDIAVTSVTAASNLMHQLGFTGSYI